MDDGHADVTLQPVGKVVGGVAGDGDGGAAASFQKLRAIQQPRVNLLLLPGQDGRRAVGHLRVAEDEGGQVLLVPLRVGAVEDALVENLCGLRPHAA